MVVCFAFSLYNLQLLAGAQWYDGDFLVLRFQILQRKHPLHSCLCSVRRHELLVTRINVCLSVCLQYYCPVGGGDHPDPNHPCKDWLHRRQQGEVHRLDQSVSK